MVSVKVRKMSGMIRMKVRMIERVHSVGRIMGERKVWNRVK